MGSKVLVKERPAKLRKYSTKIVMVHHMFGSHRTTLRHSQWLNQLGFDTFCFDLVLGSCLPKASIHPLIFHLYRGAFRLWQKQIEIVLNQIEGEKIVYAFSGPSLPTLIACSQRKDIKKIIVDGGPFADIEINTRNLFSIELGLRNEILIKTLAVAGTKIWGSQSIAEISEALARWDKNIEILSVRGQLDQIVPVASIDQIFEPHDLPLKKLEIHGGQHLDGLKNFPQLYKKEVGSFLFNNL